MPIIPMLSLLLHVSGFEMYSIERAISRLREQENRKAVNLVDYKV